ncbi:hypothetical protein [Nocardioides xinjiangensis]|uniref:hypothetical protein n=1 Tax=Nocardioides xinjiangensis TaxID=2817376 RepID=UPI001B3102FF|nr:hypothetical protein [Nocardioides sp. SYSU D00514]
MRDEQDDRQHDEQDEVYEHDEARDPDEAYDGAGADPAGATSSDEWRDGDTAEDGWTTPAGGTSRGALVAAGLVGVATTVALVLIWSALTGGSDDPAPTADAESVSAEVQGEAEATDSTVRTVATRLSRCVSAEQSLRNPLEAAQPALDQWAVHVGAMNKLVLGEITLQQATEFWERTRLGAQRRVRAFDAAVAEARQEGVDCPTPGLLAPGAEELPGCARDVQAAMDALTAAQVSVGTWREHIHHMDMLRLGQLTPEEATSMWLDSWERGVRDLDAYEAAVARALRLDGCTRVS